MAHFLTQRKRHPKASAMEGVIFEAALNDLPDTLALALSQGGDGLAQDDFGNTSLMSAAAYGHLECVQLLLPASDPDCVNADGETALMWAVKNLNHDCAGILAPVSDTALLCHQGASALVHAAATGDILMVKIVLEWSDPMLPLRIQGMQGTNAIALSKFMSYGHSREIASLISSTALARREQRALSTAIATDQQAPPPRNSL
jgi:hypothetical protein